MKSRAGTPLAVSIVAAPDNLCASVHLVGDVDMVAEPALAEAVDRLNSVEPRVMVVDLAAVTFAGATLAHFLYALRQSHPHTALVLRHASPIVRIIVKVTGLDRYVDVNDGPLPAGSDLEHLPPAVVVSARCAEEAFHDDRARLPRRGVAASPRSW